jgi:hypothetical protein
VQHAHLLKDMVNERWMTDDAIEQPLGAPEWIEAL